METTKKELMLRWCLLAVAAAVVVVGVATFSWRKMVVTYLVWMLAVSAIVLPDWEFFDRGFEEWFEPVKGERKVLPNAGASSGSKRFKIYPWRMLLFITVYSFGIYKWWIYISN